jgi:hypothetical protein
MQEKIYTFLVLSFISVSPLLAQYYSSGADPASIHWQQINTDQFKLVFPSEFTDAAKDLALFLDSVTSRVEATLDHHPQKIDILIHGRSTNTNGFVSWAPKRIELYPNPGQDNYSTEWLKQLALHEYRHVVQMDKLRQGFTKYASWLTGQQATGAVVGVYLPLWFMEGDAVTTETTLSQSGRGRLPSFSQGLRARLTKYGPDSFEKAYLGSYKNFVPNYYSMGFYLTAEVRHRYGDQIWSDVVDNVGKNSWCLIPFRKGLQQTGFNTPKEMYQSVYDSLALNWKQYDEALKTTQETLIAKGTDDYTNFEYPVMTEGGHLFAEMNGPGQRTRIVEIVPGKMPRTIEYTGSREDEPISANERWVVWSETESHIRWPNADYSVIRIYDRKLHKTTTLNHTSRYFSPALSSNGNILAIVETTGSYKFFITLVNIESGKVLKRISTPGNAFPIHPSWSDVPDELVLVLLNDSGKEVVSLNTQTLQWKTLRPDSYDEPKYPVKRDNLLWFTASTMNSEEIFRKNLVTGITDQVTQSRFGATTPALSTRDSSFIYANYTVTGYQLVKTSTFQTARSNVIPQNLTTPLVRSLTNQEHTLQLKNNSSLQDIRPYSKWNLFNLHSWAPAYINIDDEDFAPGVSLMSQNLLGTAVSRIGYNANKSDSREKFNAGFTYRGFFPVIDLDAKWGNFSEDFNNIYSNGNDFSLIDQIGKANNVKLESEIRVPLNFNIGKWSRYIQPGAKLSWQNISNRNYLQTILERRPDGTFYKTGETKKINYPDIDYWGMEYSLYLHNKLRGTSRDVNTRFGQSISAIYRHTPWGNYNSGHALALIGRIYIPGIGRHHAVVLDNGWQKKYAGDEIETSLPYRSYQRFGDLIDLPRGYNNIYNDNMYLFRGTYQMPVWNPDFSFGGIAYIKRFRLNLFFDMARVGYELNYIDTGEKIKYTDTFSSSGVELMTDFHALRFILPFSLGYRMGFRDMDNTFFHEAIFSTSFKSFLVNKKEHKF